MEPKEDYNDDHVSVNNPYPPQDPPNDVENEEQPPTANRNLYDENTAEQRNETYKIMGLPGAVFDAAVIKDPYKIKIHEEEPKRLLNKVPKTSIFMGFGLSMHNGLLHLQTSSVDPERVHMWPFHTSIGSIIPRETLEPPVPAASRPDPETNTVVHEVDSTASPPSARAALATSPQVRIKLEDNVSITLDQAAEINRQIQAIQRGTTTSYAQPPAGLPLPVHSNPPAGLPALPVRKRSSDSNGSQGKRSVRRIRRIVPYSNLTLDVKHASRDGVINLGGQTHDASEKIKSFYQKVAEWEQTITDTFPGDIANEKWVRLFKPFFQSHLSRLRKGDTQIERKVTASLMFLIFLKEKGAWNNQTVNMFSAMVDSCIGSNKAYRKSQG